MAAACELWQDAGEGDCCLTRITTPLLAAHLFGPRPSLHSKWDRARPPSCLTRTCFLLQGQPSASQSKATAAAPAPQGMSALAHGESCSNTRDAYHHRLLCFHTQCTSAGL